MNLQNNKDRYELLAVMRHQMCLCLLQLWFCVIDVLGVFSKFTSSSVMLFPVYLCVPQLLCYIITLS